MMKRESDAAAALAAVVAAAVVAAKMPLPRREFPKTPRKPFQAKMEE